MQSKKNKTRQRSLASTFAALSVAFAAGFSPVIFNLSVDPYQVFWKRDRPTAVNDIAEKSHYPLWKLARYEKGYHDTVILGDSRARALRDKYWHEAGLPRALNLAYGGGTIPEIHSTFRALQDDKSIRRLVIGIQLRSFDENHKKGMNRVPEAMKLLSNKFNYLKNWHVANKAADIFAAENPEAVERVSEFVDLMSIDAHATGLGDMGDTPLEKLLEPKVCFGCDLPEGLDPVARIGIRGLHGTHHGYLGNGFYDRYRYSNGIPVELPAYYLRDLRNIKTNALAALPSKHARQVVRNGVADWKGFEVSEKYWSYLEEIARWANARKVELFFVIPPTVTAMQKTIQQHGLAHLNHKMRVRLSGLGKVVDFDFPNALTAEANHFTDAYHFNSKVARAMVEELVSSFQGLRKPKKRNYSFALKCPNDHAGDDAMATVFDAIKLQQGIACRTWRVKS